MTKYAIRNYNSDYCNRCNARLVHNHFHYSLNRIKNKTVGQGQHGTARWATKKEIRNTYKQIDFTPDEWRTNPDSRPTEQDIIVGCKNHRGGTTALVDTGDVHALMIGAAGVGKTAYWLYPCIEYACVMGMSFMSGSVSKSKNDPSQSLQMIERPLMTPYELKNLPKGTFVVMKTGFYPMKVKLKLFFKWGIEFEEKYQVAENGNRKVEYANRAEIINGIIESYHTELTEKPAPETNYEDDENNSGKKQNSNIRTAPNSDIESTDDSSEHEENPSEDEPETNTNNSTNKKKAVLKTEAKHNEQP